LRAQRNRHIVRKEVKDDSDADMHGLRAQSERNIVSDKERKMMAMQICTGCEPKGTSISSVKRER
jgi:hypothetical protein